MGGAFREYYKTIPVDIRQSFGSTSKTAEFVYNDLNEQTKELQADKEKLRKALLEAADDIEEWSKEHKFDNWNRPDKYRKIAEEMK